MLGIITNIFHDRGYGFIIDEDWTQRYFHFKDLLCNSKDLQRKTVVSFDANINGTRHTAINIMVNIIAGLKPQNYDAVVEMLEKYHLQSGIKKDKKMFAVQKNYDITLYKFIMLNMFNIDFSQIQCSCTQKEKSNIIDGLFYHLPAPAVILLQDKMGNVRVMTGENFTMSVYEFIHNELSLLECSFRPSLNGLKFDDKSCALHPKLRDYFTNIVIHCSLIVCDDADTERIENYYRFF